MAETLKKETTEAETKAKPAKKYLVKLKKSYRAKDPKKIKILDDGEERALRGTDDKWEDGVQIHVAQGEYAKMKPGTVISITDGKLAKFLVDKRLGELTEDWD